MDVHFIIDLLAWIGGITGSLLLLMLFSSIVLGSDFDIDFDADADGGSMGILKSVLTFTSIASLTIRALAMHSSFSWLLAILFGIGAGIVAVLILYSIFRLLLGQQEDGSWKLWDAIGKVGRVYVPIPENGEGKIIVAINKVEREILARSKDSISIGTGAEVLVVETENKILVVTPYQPKS